VRYFKITKLAGIKLLKTYTIIVFTFLSLVDCISQQSLQQSLYMFDKFQYNAAYGGLDYSLSANVHFRQQWQGLDGRPSYLGFNAHLPFYVWNGALGVQAATRSLGVLDRNEVTFSYNYVLNVNGGLWSNGLRIGLDHLVVNGGSIVTPDGIYTGGSINHQEPLLLTSNDIGVGLQWELSTYYKSNTIEGGLSLSYLPGSDLVLERYSFDKKPFLTLYGQYFHTLFGEFDVLQTILLKSDLNQVQTDVASIVKINGSVFGGIGLRGYSTTSLDAIMVILGVKVNKYITLTYSYDAGLSEIRRANEGSHEILVNYNLQKLIGTGLPPKIIYNTRYL